MERFICDRLNGIPVQVLEGTPQKNAHSMMREGRFERFKCAFGSDVSDVSSLRISVPGLTRQDNFAHLDIKNGAMVITT